MALKCNKHLVAFLMIGGSLFAQNPISDKLVVTFSKPVMIGDQRIEPGEYTIRQLTSAANPRILEFTTDHGTKLQATASAIPALDNLNVKRTTVEVYESPTSYQLHRIWVEGKSYGYEFPAPTGKYEAELAQNRRMVINGTYTPERREVAQAAPAPAPVASTPEPEPQPQPPAPRREPEPTPPAPQREPEPTPAPQTEPPPAPAPQTQAQQTTTPSMPATATNWYTIALTGFLLVGLGLTLERVRS